MNSQTLTGIYYENLESLSLQFSVHNVVKKLCILARNHTRILYKIWYLAHLANDTKIYEGTTLSMI